MKTILLILLSLSSISLYAQEYPWPDGLPCGRHIGLSYKNKLVMGITQHNWYARTFKEFTDQMAIHLGKPDMKLSFDWIQYREGFKVMGDVEYAVDCQSFKPMDEEVRELMKKSDAGTLTKEDFKGGRWIHQIQPIDREEANCMALSKINGVYGGCGDIWQGGVTEDKVQCINGKNYMKCHVSCIEKIYKRDLEKTEGFCI